MNASHSIIRSFNLTIIQYYSYKYFGSGSASKNERIKFYKE